MKIRMQRQLLFHDKSVLTFSHVHSLFKTRLHRRKRAEPTFKNTGFRWVTPHGTFILFLVITTWFTKRICKQWFNCVTAVNMSYRCLSNCQNRENITSAITTASLFVSLGKIRQSANVWKTKLYNEWKNNGRISTTLLKPDHIIFEEHSLIGSLLFKYWACLRKSACTNFFFFCPLLVQEFFFQAKHSKRIFFFRQILLFCQ